MQWGEVRVHGSGCPRTRSGQHHYEDQEDGTWWCRMCSEETTETPPSKDPEDIEALAAAEPMIDAAKTTELCHILDEKRKPLCGAEFGPGMVHGGVAVADCVGCLQKHGWCPTCETYCGIQVGTHPSECVAAMRRRLRELEGKES